MGHSQKPDPKWQKPDIKDCILYDSTYIWDGEKINLEWQKIDHWLSGSWNEGKRFTTNKHEKNLEDNRNVLYIIISCSCYYPVVFIC